MKIFVILSQVSRIFDFFRGHIVYYFEIINFLVDFLINASGL